MVGDRKNSGSQKNSVVEYRRKRELLVPDTRVSPGETRNLAVVNGANTPRICVRSEGSQTREPKVSCGQETSRQMPRGRCMCESNPFMSSSLPQMIGGCRRRAREVVCAGVVRTEPLANLRSKSTISRLGLEAKKPNERPEIEESCVSSEFQFYEGRNAEQYGIKGRPSQLK